MWVLSEKSTFEKINVHNYSKGKFKIKISLIAETFHDTITETLLYQLANDVK